MRKVNLGKVVKRRWMYVLGIFCLIVMGVFGLGGCAGKEVGGKGSTPEQAVEYAMESLKKLDMEAFNECTDNYVSTQRNWIGVPVRTEYRVFSELQQPGFRGGKRYKTNHKFAEKIVEHMTWEVKDVRQDGEKAEIDMEISNIDMKSVVGLYEIRILENMLESKGSGMGQLIKDMSNLVNGMDDLIDIMDTLGADSTCTMEVTVSAYQTNGQWKIHVSDEFINAFMGNMMDDDYSLEIEQKINELMEKYEEKMEEWGEEFGEKMEKWGEEFEEKVERMWGN